jgi:hypothetical protein
MNEVTIPIKLAGLGAARAELKELKNQIIDSTDPAEIARLSEAAGVLSDRLSDASESVANFSTGSAFEQVSNQLGGIGESLGNLDFEDASEKVSTFTATVANFNPGALTKGLGALTKSVATLGTTFVKMGIQLLANPLFLLVAVIVLIVAGVLLFLNKIGVLQQAFDYLMMPINAVIQLFKDLTDWLGLSTNAADENAANVKVAMEEASEASKRRSEEIGKYYDHEIAMAKINGEDYKTLEVEKSINQANEAKGRIGNLEEQLASIAYRTDAAAEAEKKVLADKITAENDMIKDGFNKRLELYAQNEKDVAANADKVRKNAIAVGKAINEKRKADQKENDANRLAAERLIEDMRIAAIKNDAVREAEALKEKYKRLRADLLTDVTKNAIEKATLLTAYNLAETQEKDKIIEAAKLKEKEGQKALTDLTIANMVEGEAKIAAQQKIALNNSLNEAKAKYGAESVLFAETQEQLMIADAAATKARSDQKIADQKTLLDSLNNLGLTDDQRKIAAIEAQYLKEQELANGNAETLLALKNKYDADTAKVAEDAALAAIEKEKQVRDAKLTFAKDTVDGLTNLGGMLIKDQAKLAKFNKASALIQIGIDTAKAISALVAASNSNALNAVTGGGAGIAQFASGIIQIATNIAKAKQLLTAPSTPVTSGGGDTGGGGGGGSNTATMIPQAAQLFGSSNNANTMSPGGSTSAGGGTNMMVTAVVSETQITNVQKKINMINKNSEL